MGLEATTGVSLPFCGGRTDATDADGWASLSPNNDFNATADAVNAAGLLAGLTPAEVVVLAGRPRSAAQMVRMGYSGSWSAE